MRRGYTHLVDLGSRNVRGLADDTVLLSPSPADPRRDDVLLMPGGALEGDDRRGGGVDLPQRVDDVDVLSRFRTLTACDSGASAASGE